MEETKMNFRIDQAEERHFGFQTRFDSEEMRLIFLYVHKLAPQQFQRRTSKMCGLGKKKISHPCSHTHSHSPPHTHSVYCLAQRLDK